VVVKVLGVGEAAGAGLGLWVLGFMVACGLLVWIVSGCDVMWERRTVFYRVDGLEIIVRGWGWRLKVGIVEVTVDMYLRKEQKVPRLNCGEEGARFNLNDSCEVAVSCETESEVKRWHRILHIHQFTLSPRL